MSAPPLCNFCSNVGSKLRRIVSLFAMRAFLLPLIDSTTSRRVLRNSSLPRNDSNSTLARKVLTCLTKKPLTSLLRKSYELIRSRTIPTLRKFPTRFLNSGLASVLSNLEVATTDFPPPSRIGSSSETVLNIVGMISTAPSTRQRRQDCTYLKLSRTIRSTVWQNLISRSASAIQRKSILNSCRNANKVLPRITMLWCSSSLCSTERNEGSASSTSFSF